MKRRTYSKYLLLTALALLAILVSSSLAARTLASPVQQGTGLPAANLTVKSVLAVDLSRDIATMRLHKGNLHGHRVWYIITDASDFGLAHDLNVNYAPKLANAAVGCPACVQQVTLTTPRGNKFGEAVVNFEGAPNFRPKRIIAPGPMGFPPAIAQPGAVGDAHYSPFIRLRGSSVIYNAPIIARGRGPFDVIHHTNTSDRLLAIDTKTMTVKMLLVRGFDDGKEILYLSLEASDPVAATAERATFVPLLQKSAFLGGDDFLGSARERIFIMTNGQTGKNNPQAQGLAHLALDGGGAHDANRQNIALMNTLANGGDTLNVLGDFPTQLDPRHANAYSPLWDAQVGQWTKYAIAKHLNVRQTDENQVLVLAYKQKLLTGPMGAPYGSGGFIINCPIIGFINQAPLGDLVPNPLPN